MKYCRDLDFVNYGYAENTSHSTFGRMFEGYYGIQFLHRGKMFAHTGTNAPEYADSQAVFITFPETPFHYGSPEGTFRSQAHVCFRGPRVERYCSDGLIDLRSVGLFRRLRNPEFFFRTMRNLFLLLKEFRMLKHQMTMTMLKLLRNLKLDLLKKRFTISSMFPDIMSLIEW